MIPDPATEMTLAEKAILSAGDDLWSIPGVERLGIPKISVTDGPNGARGPALPEGEGQPSTCVPCGSGLGATWSPEVLEAVGGVLAREARAKGCRVLLAPTVNIHRSPLAGRNFECYSEDPLLSGVLAAAFVRGAQAEDVASTVKHFAGNEAEHQRYTSNSVIDERALREIYLLPFELAVKDGRALGVMTAYNRLNGRYCSEHEGLIAGILRGEWGFEGLVMTDWYAVGSTVGSASAGLDVEMPGPGRIFGPALAEAVESGELDESLLDAMVERVLRVWERLGALEDVAEGESGGRPPAAGSQVPGSHLLASHAPDPASVARDAASEGFVLLRNDGLLPLDGRALSSVAVIGPNAGTVQMMGGGSASLTPNHWTTPLQAIGEVLGPGVKILHEPGADTSRVIPPITAERLERSGGGGGFEVQIFGPDGTGGTALHRAERPDGHLLFLGPPAPQLASGPFTFRAVSRFRPTVTGPHELSLVQLGRARVLLDGALILDGTPDAVPSTSGFPGLRNEALRASANLREGIDVEIVVECSCPDTTSLTGTLVGCRPAPAADLADRAEAAATEADAAVVVVGTSAEWESEGRDRSSLELPGGQDALVERVAAANPNTVVVLNTGAPVTAPWANRARAILQIWFGGEEMATALAEVLVGRREPAGRLPMTWPRRLEDNPSYGNFPGERDEVRYGEGVLVGYRWYDARSLPTLFPFGHGLSYTTFEISPPRLSTDVVESACSLELSVDVTNTGSRRGAEVVQCYVGEHEPSVVRPPKELKSFSKVWLDPGETRTVTMHLDGRAFAYWDPGTARRPDPAQVARSSPFAPSPEPERQAGWHIEKGTFDVHVARSAADVLHSVAVEVRPEVRPG